MTKEKVCGDCEHYREGRGKYGTGICVSKESKKNNKNLCLKVIHVGNGKGERMENKVEISLNDYNNMRDELNKRIKTADEIEKAITRYKRMENNELKRLSPFNFEIATTIEIELNKIIEAIGFDKDIEVIIK